MALLTHTIPNLMNGVSQQPATVRLDNQAEDQVNATCRVSDGLSKRLAIEMFKENKFIDPIELWDLTPDDLESKMHMIKGTSSSGQEQIVQLLVDGNSGTLLYQYLTSPYAGGTIGQYPYLALSGKDSLKFLTNGDTTYILNKEVLVTQTAPGGDSPETAMRKQGSIGAVKNGYFGTTYTLDFYIKNVVTDAVVYSWTGITFTTNSSSATTNITELQTTHIANNNTNGLGKLLNDVVTNPANVWFAANLAVERSDNWFRLYFTNSPAAAVYYIEMKCTSSTAEAAILAFNGVSSDPIKLPKSGPDGYVMRIDADPTASGDHYYLQYDRKINGWKESKILNIGGTIDSDTLPLQIFGLIDGPISASHMTIADREVGDAETCPDPSFVNNKINDMFIFNNRLGFLSKNNLILSRIDEFDVFYRTSTATSLSADRVDLTAAVPSSRYTDLKTAIPFETHLMMFGNSAQYLLGTNVGFDVTKTSLQTATEYDMDSLCNPVNTGASIYFPVLRGDYTGIFDMSRKDGVGLTAEEVTHHIPTYIKGRAVEMTFSSVENILFVRTLEEKRTIYVQNRFIRQTVLEQNAWHKWTVPNDIIYINVMGSKLYIVMVAEDGKTLLHTSVDISTTRINQDPDSLDLSFKPYLDMLRLVPQGEVLTISDYGGIFIPPEHETLLVGVDSRGGQVLGLAAINEALVTKDMWIGIPFEFSYTFSEQVPATQDAQGKAVYQYGRLTLRSMKVSYTNTGKFDVEVTPSGRESFTTKFSGYILGGLLSILGRINISSGAFKFPVNSRSNAVTITIKSSYPYPCTFNTCEWQGTFTNNSGRM